MADASQLSLAAGGTSTISHGKLEEPDHSSSNWYFTREEIERNSPSRKDGIDLKKEAYLRKSYCTFLQDLGMRLKVPQVTIATAMVFCHRFFLRQSHHRNDRYMIATVCMFLAGKVEETPKPLRDVILISYEIRYKKDPAAVQRIKQKEVYEEQKEAVLLGERLVLTTLGFDLNIHHPYKPLVAAIKKFKVAQNALAQVAWNFVNDGLRTSLCLQFKPHHIAAGAIFLAAKFLKVKLPSDGEKVWWQEFEVTPRQLEEVSNQMLELYEQNREPPASRSGDQGGVVGVGNRNKTGPSPRAAGEAQPSASGHSHLLQQSPPSSAMALPEKLVPPSEVAMRREDDGQVSVKHAFSSTHVKQINGMVEITKEQVHGVGTASVKEYTLSGKSIGNGSARREDEDQSSLRYASTFTQVKQSSGLVDTEKDQVHGALGVQQGAIHSKTTVNGPVKQESAVKNEKQDIAVRHEFKDCEGNTTLSEDAAMKEDQKYVGDVWNANKPRNKLDSGSVPKARLELHDEYASGGMWHERKDYTEEEPSAEHVQVERDIEKNLIGECKTRQGTDDFDTRKCLGGIDGVDTHRLKAVLEKRRKFRGEGGDARPAVAKFELTDEEELLERELENGVEVAAEAEKAKQEKKEKTLKLLQRSEYEALESKRERMEEVEGGVKRKRPNEESYMSEQRRLKSHDRADSIDGEHEKFAEAMLDRSEDGELLTTTGQDQARSPKMDRRNQAINSPVKRRDYGSRDQHGRRDTSYDGKHRHGHNRDHYHHYSHHQQHPHRVDTERDHRHYKDRDWQEREYKKARHDHVK
eukprot:c28154_g2_i2 orf=529-2946(-)